MAVAMIGPKFYAWDRNGKPLAFGKLYTYEARTNIPKATYQSEDQVVENTNPVILNGEGYANVYLSGRYKMVLKDKNENEIWSSDPVSSNLAEEWVDCVTASYLSPTTFKLVGNFTDSYTAGRKVRLDSNAINYDYTSIVSSIYSAGETTVTVIDPVVKTGLVQTCVSVVGAESSFNKSDLGNLTDYVFDDVAAMKTAVTTGGQSVVFKEGMQISSGKTRWRVVSTSGIDIGFGLYAEPINSPHLSDFGSDKEAFEEWGNIGGPLILDIDVSLDSEPIIEPDVAIGVPNTQTITVTSTVQHAVTFKKKCTIVASHKLIVDTDGRDLFGGLYFDLDLPILENVEARNTFNFAGLAGGSPEGDGGFKAVGRGVFRKVGAVDCGKGWHIYGNSNKETTVLWEDCYTEGTTGSDGNVYWLSDHKLVEIYGGDFRGDPDSGPNAYRTNEITIQGGHYIGLNRGATIGLDTGKGTISGVYSQDCNFSGVSVDLKRNDESIPDGFIDVGNCVAVGCDRALFLAAQSFHVHDMTAYDCLNADSIFRLNGSPNDPDPTGGTPGRGSYDNLRSYGHPGSVVRIGNNLIVNKGKIYHDSPADRVSIEVAGTSQQNTHIEEQVAHKYESSFDLPTGVNLIYLDTTAGIIDVDLSSKTFADIRNREVRFVIVGGGSNNVTFTIDGGSSNGSVNGGTAYTWTAPPIGNQIVAVQQEKGNWFVG